MKRQDGFSLIEMVLVVAILSVLASLMFPAMKSMQESAEKTRCLANLRQIGITVLVAVADHDNRFPYIETDTQNPTYPPEQGAKGLLETLEPYGLKAVNVQCPSDLKGANYFAKKGTSYEWRPVVDGETAVSPEIHTRLGAIQTSLSRIRLVMDYERVHDQRMNYLYADGHVR